jgi:Amt family ammonium transporter
MKKTALTLGRGALLGLGAMALLTGAALAQGTPPAAKAPDLVVNKGDDAWMLISSALVLLMTIPGLALFYGGMVRTKNMLSMITQVTVIFCIVCVVWFLWGYSLAFTEGSGVLAPFVGGFSKLFLSGVAINAKAETFTLGVGIHELIFICFQMTFAGITTALAIGGFAERAKFSAIVLFAILWSTIVYFPIAHMVWFWPGPSGIATGLSTETAGFTWQFGALDFAGGTVVHINAGVAGFVGALLLGRRLGYKREPMPPHSLTLTLVGVGLLWTGWFGFNAGSNLEANEYAGLAMANTFIATAAAGLSWMFTEWLFKGKPSLLGLASGVVAGLVAVTPAAGFGGPMGTLVLGLVAGIVCFFFCTAVKSALGYDDTLDVFGVHAVGGIVGALGTGIVVDPALGGAGIVDYSKCEVVEGVFTSTCAALDYNMVTQLMAQAKGVLVTLVWSGVGSFVVYMIIAVLVGLRVTEETEREGLDIVDHGERAYNM